MEKVYTVFSAHDKLAEVDAKLADGTDVKATVGALELQLVPGDSASGTVKITITGVDAVLAARDIFVVGKEVVATFAAKGE